MTTPVPSFRMQQRDGTYSVYLIRVDGIDIPVDRQRAVFSSRALGKAQAVHDALNAGLLPAIGMATTAERGRRQHEH